MAIFLFIFLMLMLVYTAIVRNYYEQWKAIPLSFTIGDESLTVSGVYSRPRNDTSAPAEKRTTGVTVIVPVRNEAGNIEQLIQHLLSQHFTPPTYEVLIVDDHSEDQTVAIASVIKHPALRVLTLPENLAGKKAAISFGVEHATGELIITTDADCTHQSLWVHAIVHAYEHTHARFIVAPVQMISGNTLLGIFQRLDFMVLQAITGASVDAKLHCMCNGANLAYEKAAFKEVNGFEGIDQVPSGDDMLLMYKIFKRFPGQVYYLKNKSAIVKTSAEPTWKRFFQQRVRWASKGVHYDDKKIFAILMITYLVNLGFLALGIVTIIQPFYAWMLLLFLLMKILVEFPLIYSVSSFFGERRILFFFPVFQPLHILYMVVAGWLGRFGSYNWKSRTIKNTGRSKLAKQ